MKRVRYIVDKFPSLTERFIYREAEELKRNGYSIHIIALNKSDDDVKDTASFVDDIYYVKISIFYLIKFLLSHPIMSMKLIFDVTLSILKYPKYGLQKLNGLLLAISTNYNLEIKPEDIIHCQFGYVTADLARFLAKINKKTWSLSLHAWDIFCQKKKILEARLITAHKIFFCTNHAINYVAKKIPSLASKSIMMKHGIKINHQRISKNSRTQILTVARLTPKKGISFMIQACSILQQKGVVFKYVIVGDGPEKEKLSRLIDRLNLSCCVELKGGMNWSNVEIEYSKAIMLVVPSVISENGDRDGMPNVIPEAMLMNVPVIASDAGGVGELIENGVNGLMVEAGNIEQLAENIEILLKNSQLREIVTKNGRYVVNEQFNIQNNIKPMLEYFERSNR